MTESQTDKHPDNLGFKLIDMKPRSQVRCNALGLKTSFTDFELEDLSKKKGNLQINERIES